VSKRYKKAPEGYKYVFVKSVRRKNGTRAYPKKGKCFVFLVKI